MIEIPEDALLKYHILMIVKAVFITLLLKLELLHPIPNCNPQYYKKAYKGNLIEQAEI